MFDVDHSFRWDDAFAACDRALRLDEKHIKSLLRRAQAGLRGAAGTKRSLIEEDIELALSVDPSCKVRGWKGLPLVMFPVLHSRTFSCDFSRPEDESMYRAQEALTMRAEMARESRERSAASISQQKRCLSHQSSPHVSKSVPSICFPGSR